MRLLAVLVLAIVAASCGSSDHRAFIREHVDQIKGLTIPAGAAIKANSETQFGQFSVSADWKFETDMSETDYRRWVQRQLHDKVNETKVIEHRLLLLEDFRGDAQSLTLETVSEKPKLQIKTILRILSK